jgi:DNA polymerase-3 subunit alpha (Gram-positive type)
METTKKIGEVFSDYKQESNVKNAQIKQMNLIKKANVLDMQIASEEYLESKNLWLFEQFLRERFQFENVDIKIEYSEDVKINSIEYAESCFGNWGYKKEKLKFQT